MVLLIELHTCIIHVAEQLLYINWQHKLYTKCMYISDRCLYFTVVVIVIFNVSHLIN